jgi:[acyl-carrier-protein] S-malonyltransferase
LSTVDVRWRTEPDGLAELLTRWLLLPVRWYDATAELRRRGVTRVVDAGPGDVLRKLGRRDRIVEFAEPARAR